jgi:hypothetical protein
MKGVEVKGIDLRSKTTKITPLIGWESSSFSYSCLVFSGH